MRIISLLSACLFFCGFASAQQLNFSVTSEPSVFVSEISPMVGKIESWLKEAELAKSKLLVAVDLSDGELVVLVAEVDSLFKRAELFTKELQMDRMIEPVSRQSLVTRFLIAYLALNDARKKAYALLVASLDDSRRSLLIDP
jgi:hypothetical protein